MSLKRQLAEEEGFLGRWSRLKQKSRSEPEQEPEEEIPDTGPEAELPARQAEQDAEPLPDIETLGQGSDFKPFMDPEIAPELRSQALRKLWASNPLYNHIDMLDDYCEDYTDKAVVIPGMKTAYKIGRGLLKELASDEAKTEPVDVSGAETATASDGQSEDEHKA